MKKVVSIVLLILFFQLEICATGLTTYIQDESLDIVRLKNKFFLDSLKLNDRSPKFSSETFYLRAVYPTITEDNQKGNSITEGIFTTVVDRNKRSVIYTTEPIPALGNMTVSLTCYLYDENQDLLYLSNNYRFIQKNYVCMGESMTSGTLELSLENRDPFDIIKIGNIEVDIIRPRLFSTKRGEKLGDRYLWFSRSIDDKFNYQYVRKGDDGTYYSQSYEDGADFTVPALKNGDKSLLDYVKQHIIYPREAYEAGKEGLVITRCVIDLDGSVSEIEVLNSPDSSFTKEAIRLLEGTKGLWIPASLNNQPIVSYRYVSIPFQLLKSGIKNVSEKTTEIIVFYLLIGFLVFFIVYQRVSFYRKNKRFF